MITLDSLKILKSRRSAVLALTLDGRVLEGAVVRRSTDGIEVAQVFETTLSLDPLTNDVQLVGQEIRNHLDRAEVRVRRCVIGVPLSWAMTLPVKLPEIPEADIPGFLSIQAERGFPFSPEDLSIASTRYGSAETGRHALLVAIPKTYLTRLEEVLSAARLEPASLTLPIAALQPPEGPSRGTLTMQVGQTGVDLQVSALGGVAVLRTLPGAIEVEGANRQIDSELLTREVRLTLGQLPAGVRETVKSARIFARAGRTQSIADQLSDIARRCGLVPEVVPIGGADKLTAQAAVPPNPSPAFVLAVRYLAGQSSTLEFLSPKVSNWMELASRFSTRKILWAGAGAGGVILLICGAFLVQYIRLSILESRWRDMGPRADEIQFMQDNIRKYRSWYDHSARALTILKHITETFPEDGVVSVKTLEIKDLADISCTGVAEDNQALLKLLDRLRATNHIENLKVEQVRGKTPLQFTFNFHWSEEGTREN